MQINRTLSALLLALLCMATAACSALAEPNTTTAVPTSGTTTRTVEPNTLILQDIITVDGVQKAMLVWDGKDYTLAAGDVIAGTPWKLLSMTKTSVTMLYGDVQVTLSIGEGVGR
jgi:hypothetical protein